MKRDTKIEGGRRAAQTNKERYGEDFYKKIGKKGGTKSRGGGFAADPERARRAGQIGGRNSRRSFLPMECDHFREEAETINGVRYLKCTTCQKVRRG